MPLAAWKESSLEEKICYPSHKTTFVCLPGPSKPLTRLGSTQWQQSLSSLPLSPSLFSPLRSLPFCSSSFASTMQTFSGLSAPPLLRELQHKTSLCGQTAGAHTHINTQKCKLTQKLKYSRQRLTLSVSHMFALLAFSRPALCRANREK